MRDTVHAKVASDYTSAWLTNNPQWVDANAEC